jgi:hypothetical protein
LQLNFKPLERDRPLAPEVRQAVTLLQAHFSPFSAGAFNPGN